MKNKITLLVFVGMTLGLFLVVGCGEKDKQQSEQVSQANETGKVVDSLLDEQFMLESAKLSLRIPVGFNHVSDSFFQALQAYFLKQGGEDNRVHLEKFYINKPTGSGVVIFSVDSLNLATDTAEFFHNYGQSLALTYGGTAKVGVSEQRINDVLVKGYTVSDSVTVRHQFLCIPETGSTMELHYVFTKPYYTKLLPLMKSSLYTLKKY